MSMNISTLYIKKNAGDDHFALKIILISMGALEACHKRWRISWI